MSEGDLRVVAAYLTRSSEWLDAAAALPAADLAASAVDVCLGLER